MVDIAKVQAAASRTGRWAVTQRVDKANRKTAWKCLEHSPHVIASYRVHTILADNDIQFAEQFHNRRMAWSRSMHFDLNCAANGFEHRLIKPNHP
ncbi:hypothetical protein [Komagataeibacter swingsii]|uniref:hypothetical protein n=1 Tax=Komagataeibacter swingsii TaxID=215220 RepID=UPI0038CFDCCD